MTSTNHCSGSSVIWHLCSRTLRRTHGSQQHAPPGGSSPPLTAHWRGLADTSPRHGKGQKQKFFLFLSVGWKQMSRSCASLKKPGVWDEVVLKSFLYGTCEQDRETKRRSVCEGKAVTGSRTSASSSRLACLILIPRFWAGNSVWS